MVAANPPSELIRSLSILQCPCRALPMGSGYFVPKAAYPELLTRYPMDSFQFWYLLLTRASSSHIGTLNLSKSACHETAPMVNNSVAAPSPSVAVNLRCECATEQSSWS
eukprot:6840361-Pyramimonas_sp.AAC.1